MRIVALLAVLLTACSSSQQQPPAPLVPEWQMIPAGVVSALCSRLQTDTVANGATLTIVTTTQPIATGSVVAALSQNGKRRRQVPPPSNASIPIQVPSGACSFKPAERLDPEKQYDEMVVELSAPFANPFGREAGMVARVSLGGQHPAYYYIPLASRGDQWSIGYVSVLAQ